MLIPVFGFYKAAMSICVQVFFCEYEFSFVWDKCPRVQLLGPMMGLCLFFSEIAELFSKVSLFPLRCMNISVSLHPRQHFVFSLFFIVAIPINVQW